MTTATKLKTATQIEIEALARRIARRKVYRDAARADGTFGEFAAAIGLDMADYRQLAAMTGGHHSGAEALAWVELGRPAIEMYTECAAADVPAAIRFDTPRRNQGQIVTYSYGTTGRGEAGRGSPYMSRHDASCGEHTVYRRTWVDARAARAE